MAKSIDDLKTDLELELKRSTGTLGDLAIAKAIKTHASRRWWFNENLGADEVITIANQEYYTFPVGVEFIDDVIAELNGDYPLTRKSDRIMNKLVENSSPYRGRPDLWSTRGSRIRLYPLPDGVYTLRTYGYGALSFASNDTSNPWSNEAYNVIIAEARMIYEVEYLERPEAANGLQSLVNKHLGLLESENERKLTGSGS